MVRDDWKLPLNLAIGFHIVVALSCVYLPQILNNKPKHPKIYTVDLTNFVEAVPQQQAVPPKKTPLPVAKPVETKARKVAPIAPAEPVKQNAPEKVISLKPLKRKIKKKLPPQPDPQVNKRRIEEAKKAQREAEEAARIAKQEAEFERKLLMDSLRDAQQVAQQNQNRTDSFKPGSNSSNQTSSAALSGIEKRFFNAIVSHLHSYWQLPEHKSWDKNLATTIAITINSKGKIKSMYIESSSGDKIFDQYVQKALRAADPLPNIPPAMKKSYFDIGLVFKPGGIQ